MYKNIKILNVALTARTPDQFMHEKKVWKISSTVTHRRSSHASGGSSIKSFATSYKCTEELLDRIAAERDSKYRPPLVQ